MGSGTVVMMSRQHLDRWASFGAHAGVLGISSLLRPDQLRHIELLQEFDDDFLRDISADVAIAKWDKGATVFEAGSYLDMAFFIMEGEVEMQLGRGTASHRPIFTTKMAPQAAASTDEQKRAVLLTSADFDLRQGETLRLRQGEVFGEIGAMNGWPQSVTARTATPCTLVQIRLPALRKLRRKSKKLKQR